MISKATLGNGLCKFRLREAAVQCVMRITLNQLRSADKSWIPSMGLKNDQVICLSHGDQAGGLKNIR